MKLIQTAARTMGQGGYLVISNLYASSDVAEFVYFRFNFIQESTNTFHQFSISFSCDFLRLCTPYQMYKKQIKPINTKVQVMDTKQAVNMYMA